MDSQNLVCVKIRYIRTYLICVGLRGSVCVSYAPHIWQITTAHRKEEKVRQHDSSGHMRDINKVCCYRNEHYSRCPCYICFEDVWI